MYTTIVDPSTLYAHLDDPAWVIFDCRNDLANPAAGEALYAEGHIPGAYGVQLERVLTGVKTGRNGRHPLPEPGAFAHFLQAAGVGPATQIAAYDGGGGDMFAARFWFLARWLGHAAVALLDGGYQAWTSAGFPVSREAPPPRQAPGGPALEHDELTAQAGEILASLNGGHLLVLDARSPDRFAGQNEIIDPVAGHIPGAANRFYKENFDASGRLKPAEVLRAEFAAAGVRSPVAVVHQCGSGVSACVNLLAMEHAGLRGSRLYPGSWSEWIADPARPVARD
ncbi:sulfurtransferase [bacterium]|nr:MAG: sulfurtransferase [bacterium]